MGNNNIGIKKCRTIFLWVLYFGEVGEIFKNFQKHPVGESFRKNGTQLVGPRGWFLRPNFRVDFFLVRKFFKGISYVKLEACSIFW